VATRPCRQAYYTGLTMHQGNILFRQCYTTVSCPQPGTVRATAPLPGVEQRYRGTQSTPSRPRRPPSQRGKNSRLEQSQRAGILGRLPTAWAVSRAVRGAKRNWKNGERPWQSVMFINYPTINLRMLVLFCESRAIPAVPGWSSRSRVSPSPAA
jgi:hypothetical protein